MVLPAECESSSPDVCQFPNREILHLFLFEFFYLYGKHDMTDMSSVFITVMRPNSQSCVAEVQIHCHLFLAYLYHLNVNVAHLTSSVASECGKFTVHNSTRVTLPAWVYQPSDSFSLCTLLPTCVSMIFMGLAARGSS